MNEEGRLKEYLGHFCDFVVHKAVDVHPKMAEAIVLATYPIRREIWCVFVYGPEIEDIEARFGMWTDFWEALCERRNTFYSEFKKPGLGYVTLYPLFVSSERLQELRESPSAE